eukprot:COSAG01_NODE_53602_length_338_cov_0.610879_1_plen_54_part_10
MSYITDTSTPASKVIHLDSAHAHIQYSKDEDFFKQKTAYVILRSDWSSDVCSSD